jgi:hypothetical protein
MSGSATISAIAVLENPRVDSNKGKNILFDAHLFIYGDPKSTGHADLALLRYYNEQDLTFEEVGRYFIVANVCVHHFSTVLLTHKILLGCTDGKDGHTSKIF